MSHRLSRLFRPLLLLAGFWLFFHGHAAQAAQSLPHVSPAIPCEALMGRSFSSAVGEKVRITKAAILQTGQGAFCKVSAVIAPEIGVEVALPAERWTQRFLQLGCGGLCGTINLSPSNTGTCTPALKGEFTVAATNMGHSGSMMEAGWADDPQKRIDFAYRANHLTARLGKALISAYYGQPARYAYFMGCSDGGREALMEAQRYPEDFNGISAGAPAAFFQFQNSFYHGWNITANQRPDGSAILLKDRLPLLHQAVLAHCPTLSGINDGLLQNPYACTFSPSWVRQCRPGQVDRTGCLTQEEVMAAQRLYQGAGDDSGNRFVLGGLPPGSELRWPVPETTTGHSMSEMMVLPALQSVLLPRSAPEITSMKAFPLTLANFRKVAELAPLYNAGNTNLAPFMRHGGRLIMWHGLADDSVSPVFSIAYYRGVRATLGEAATRQFLRLFLLPGVGHCGNGEGYDQIDLLSPLMDWTEQGRSPERLISGKRAANPAGPAGMSPDMPPPPGIPHDGSSLRAGGPLADTMQTASRQFHGMSRPSIPVSTAPPRIFATRPVFPYPYIARFTGRGDRRDASSYRAIRSDAFEQILFRNPAIRYIGPDNQADYQSINGRLVPKDAGTTGPHP